jgi:hypothetical protein
MSLGFVMGTEDFARAFGWNCPSRLESNVALARLA